MCTGRGVTAGEGCPRGEKNLSLSFSGVSFAFGDAAKKDPNVDEPNQPPSSGGSTRVGVRGVTDSANGGLCFRGVVAAPRMGVGGKSCFADAPSGALPGGLSALALSAAEDALRKFIPPLDCLAGVGAASALSSNVTAGVGGGASKPIMRSVCVQMVWMSPAWSAAFIASSLATAGAGAGA